MFAIGEFGLLGELEAIGMNLTDDEPVDYVVVGIDRKFNYDTLVKAQRAILGGAKFIATNPDTTYPLEEGRVVPGNGALVAAIRAATGVEPIMIGKPETTAMHEILELAHATPADTVVVGDRLDTDILAGNRIGAITVLVLTGIGTMEEVCAAGPDMKPRIIIKELPELLDVINA
jgi:4-nitrophenyl phosphatase